MLSSSNSAIENITRELSGREMKNFYDLGSGKGKILCGVASHYPGIKFIGIEYNIAEYLFAKIKNIFSGNNVFYWRSDIFKINLSDADVVYMYLFPGIMNRLETKLTNELKKGTLVIVNTFSLKSRKPTKILCGVPGKLNTLYVYEW